jgi:hypothetical protein
MIVLHAGLEAERLVLWGERQPESAGRLAKRPGRKPRLPRPDSHPFGADARALEEALAEAGLPRKRRTAETRIAWLPGRDGAPVASSPLLAPAPEPTAGIGLRPWTVTVLDLPLAEAVDILVATGGRDMLAPGVLVGADLAYAAAALGLAAGLVARERYLPGLEERDGVFRAVWRPVISGPDAARLARLARAMPEACRALGQMADAPPDVHSLTLLTGFVEAAVDHLARASGPEGVALSERTRVFDTPHDEWLAALSSPEGVLSGRGAELARLAGQIREWQRAVATGDAAPFRLTFRLEEPPAASEGEVVEAGGAWRVRYLLQASDDPSLLVLAEDAWKDGRSATLKRAGFQPREHLLASLGQAAGLDPRIERSLCAPAPSGYELDAAEAFEFLSRRSMALEQAGFGVLLPAWWTRKGARARLSAAAVVKSPKLKGRSGLSLDELVRFEWRIAVGGAP